MRKLVVSLCCVTAIFCFSTGAVAQGDWAENEEDDSWDGFYDPYTDEAEVIPYFELYVLDEPWIELAYAESDVISYVGSSPVPPDVEVVGKNEVVDPDVGGTETIEQPYSGLLSTGSNYVNYPGPCDPALDNRIIVKSGLSAGAGSVANLYVCFGERKKKYTHPNHPDYYRPEYERYGSLPALYTDANGSAAGCLNLGQMPTTTGQEKTYYFCDETTYGYFFSSLEPDDIKHVRFVTVSGDGLEIDRIALVFNQRTIYDQTGINYWLDRYHNTQLDLTSRISEHKRNIMAAFSGTDYPYSILDRAAQELGIAGSRKYAMSDSAWCSEFALYAIMHGGIIQDGWCSNPPPVMTDIGVDDMRDWFGSCSKRIDSIRTNTGAMRTGYYLSVNNRTHSVIFINWKPGDPTRFYAIEGNSSPGNRTRLTERVWLNDVLANDFAGKTHGE
jgi:hypothetical protein